MEIRNDYQMQNTTTALIQINMNTAMQLVTEFNKEVLFCTIGGTYCQVLQRQTLMVLIVCNHWDAVLQSPIWLTRIITVPDCIEQPKVISGSSFWPNCIQTCIFCNIWGSLEGLKYDRHFLVSINTKTFKIKSYKISDFVRVGNMTSYRLLNRNRKHATFIQIQSG